MRMMHIRIIMTLAALCGVLGVQAQKFLDTGAPASLFDVSVRVGFNAANHTFSNKYFKQWNVNSWGTGVGAGAVVSLNLRDFISLQPGFFYDTHTGNYAYSQDYWSDLDYKLQQHNQMGHWRTYNMTVPLLVSLRFNLASTVKWVVEAGPYMQWHLKSTDNKKIDVIKPQEAATDPLRHSLAEANKFDAGLKIGSGIEYKRKYGFYIHYLGGGMNVWKAPYEGGRNKAWTFMASYTL